MASRNGKRVRRPQPLALTAAGTILLLGWHMHALLSDIPRERVAAYPPQTLPPAPPDLTQPATSSPAPALDPLVVPPAALKSEGPELASKAIPTSPLPLWPPAPRSA